MGRVVNMHKESLTIYCKSLHFHEQEQQDRDIHNPVHDPTWNDKDKSLKRLKIAKC